MSRKIRLTERNERIYKHFKKLKEEKEYLVQKYSYQRILAELSHKYYLSEITIEKIILKQKK